MPRLINSEAQLPAQLSFLPVMRAIDSKQVLQSFNANNSTAISASQPSAITVRFNSSFWLNGMSSYFKFDATLQHTTSGETATFRKGISCLFKSITILNNGVVIEQITETAVLDRLFQLTQIGPSSVSNWDAGHEAVADRPTTASGGTVTAVRSYTMQPLSGFLNSPQLIPLWGLGELEIRLELNTNVEGIFNPDITNALTTGADFTVSNFRYVAELHDLPASFNQGVQAAINQSGLSYNIPTYDTITFNADTGATQDQLISNNSKSVKAVYFVLRPSANVGSSTQEYNFESDTLSHTQLRVGASWYPLEEMESPSAQSWKELTKAVAREGHYSNHYDITQAQYRGTFTPTAEEGNKCIIAFDLEKFGGSGLVTGTDFSEVDIFFRHKYSSNPTAGNKWYCYILKDSTMTIMPGFNVIMAS